MTGSDRKTKRSHICPKCGGGSIEREMHPNLFRQMVIAVLPVRSYACRDCGRRYWDRPTTRD